MFVRITSLAVAAAILAVATIPASANAAGEKTRALSAGYESVTVEVRTDDLNLATVSGRDSLDRRIESTAHRVCGYNNGPVELSVHMHQKACLSTALTKARAIAAAKISQSSALAAK